LNIFMAGDQIVLLSRPNTGTVRSHECPSRGNAGKPDFRAAAGPGDAEKTSPKIR
jgi:hypothetical protein